MNRFGSRRLAVLGLVFLMVAADLAWSEIRFYRMRRDGNIEKLHLVRGTAKPGCHNLGSFRRVHQVTVLEFSSCTLYRKPDCPAGEEITAYWKKKPDRAETRLTEGSRWFLDPEGNVAVRAWRCED